MNLEKDLATWADYEKKVLHVVIEVSRNTSNKIEYRPEGYFELDRTLYHQMFYNFDYGFLPQTLEGDGDPIDVILLATHPLPMGCVVKSRVIGMIHTADQDGPDMKLICVPVDKVDPRWSHVQSINDLNPHTQEELLGFFKEYKKLEKGKYDKVMVEGFKSIDHAHELIDKAIENYKHSH
ncbi:MAG TPA: inorganic diphosphatase [Candidatus Absconditabacterales bacterium]|nr:inorganic diphosphatase [Candidatus Absconditabacterales bacterium]HNG96786.1 inorganic diphosphatase [Candidatus Absconditabacterales bacterium]